MMKTKSIFLSFLVLLTLVFYFTGSTRANAPIEEGERNKRGLILTSRGLVKFLKADPGETVKGTFKLTNDYDPPQDINIHPAAINFIDNNGTPEIDTMERESSYDLASWISFPEKDSKITLSHLETREFKFTINIPESASGGTHTAMLVFAKDNSLQDKMNLQESGSKIFLAEQVRLPIFLTLDRDINFQSEISDIYVTDKANNKTSFFWSGKQANIHTVINNPGNIYVRPYGNLFIHKGDKSDPIQTFEFNPNNSVVPQKSDRELIHEYSTGSFYNEDQSSLFKKFDFTNFFDFQFGRHYATYISRIEPSTETSLSDTDANVLVVEETVSFFVFPIQFIFIITLLSITIIIFVIYKISVKKNHKNTNKAKL